MKNIPLNEAYRLINSSPVVLITSAYKNQKNVMTLNWLNIINSEPFIIGAAIAKDSYTSYLIEKTKEFGINVPDKKLLPQIKLCGNLSGREVDKFKKANLNIFEAEKIKAPLIKECSAFIECKVKKKLIFGDVNFFIAEAVSAKVNEKIFNKIYNIDKIKFVHHLGGGNFYFSSKK